MILQKTDAVDAKVIAEFCLQNKPDPWKPRLPEQKSFMIINVRILALKNSLNRSSNALENKKLTKIVVQTIQDEITLFKKQIALLKDKARKSSIPIRI